MESGSGLGSVNETFNCRTSDLNPNAVTDTEFWSLRESVVRGGPAIAFFESLIFCVAVGWNLFIVITYILKYKLLKEPANIFLFSLAITDILFCVLVVPFTIVSAAAGEFLIGNNDIGRCIACSTQGFFYVLFTILSIHLLTMLSIDRFILLSKPLTYRKYRKPHLAVAGVIFVCIWCFLFSIPPAFGFGQWEFNRNFGLCLPRWSPINNLYYMGVVILESLIPIILLLVMNIWTYKIISLFLKRKLVRRKSIRSRSQGGIDSDDISHQQQQRQLVKVFGALFIANIITWTPTVVIFISVIITGGDIIPDWIYIIGWLTYLTNPMIHPILEAFFIKELRTRVNRAKSNVRRSVRRASSSIVRMTTQERLKNIPKLPDESPNLNRRFIPSTSSAPTSPQSTVAPNTPLSEQQCLFSDQLTNLYPSIKEESFDSVV